MVDVEFGRMSIKESKVEGKDGSSPVQPHWYEQYIQPCMAELVGSAFFIFMGCISVIENVDGTGRLQPALVHGLALGLTIAVLGNISGGHYNPAVSLGAWLVGGLNMVMVIPYWISQLCGGLIGAAFAKAVTADESYQNASGAAFTTITSDDCLARAVVSEVIMTMFLVMAVCMGAINERTKGPLAPFCIGFTVTVDILAGGAISGACMNPARAFGPALVANYWDYHWVYWVGPMVAGLLVGALIRFLLGDKKTRIFLK
ncbi:aquaporin-8 [Eublepharis macularius]|uniref:Aquaporin-8 n=1 Tax=Eublepharis macularius TaxID=481883 RepID=A0AA97K6C5_EUBMA|nr:aquaporin-8 [Eublepharis macularius]